LVSVDNDEIVALKKRTDKVLYFDGECTKEDAVVGMVALWHAEIVNPMWPEFLPPKWRHPRQ